MEEKIQIAKQKIREADAILIGASNGLSIAEGYNIFACDERFKKNFFNFQKKYKIQSVIEGGFFPFPNESEAWSFFSRMAAAYTFFTKPSELMKSLFSLVQKKPHFVVTSNTDCHFVRAGFSQNRIFEIEGSVAKMQCANACTDLTFESEEAIFQMRKGEEKMEIPKKLLPKCPACGGPMILNIPINENFLRGKNWHFQKNNFENFVNEFCKKRLLVLELGIGSQNQMIKRPLMTLVQTEPEAFYITLNKGDIFIAQEIRERSLALDGDIAKIVPLLLDE